MKDKKTMIRFFSVAEWEKEQEFLRRQHQKGWKLVKINGLCLFHFERCQPEDVIYQLDYNREGMEHQEEYVQMFRDCGWEYLQDYVGYSYFRKPASQMQGEESIFCDEDSRMDMLLRVWKGRVRPLLFIFLFLLIPNLVLAVCDKRYPTAAVFAGLMVVYLVIFAKVGRKFWNCRNSAPKK